MKTLVPVLGDQLSETISSLQSVVKNEAVVLFTECLDEASYVSHHKKKLVLVFSCMRHFAKSLGDNGWKVDYCKLGDKQCPDSIDESIRAAVKRHDCEQIVITEPGEYRLKQALVKLQESTKTPLSLLEDTRFICSHQQFRKWAGDRKQLRMENFYREMRRYTDLLMDDNEPDGGQWNFDKQNRKPAGGSINFSAPLRFSPDDITNDCIAIVKERFAGNIGDVDDFWFASNAHDANKALDHFIEFSLPQFGDYQDAMLAQEKFLSHSVLSMYINIGLLDPKDVCVRVEQAYKEGQVPINAAEGYIRQIIGWREYMRGIYWLKMPGYIEHNYFNHQRPLPDFFWTGDTRMACMKASIDQTIKESYAHHIQRLMVTGNFAMLTGVEPRQVHEWYLAVYADAYEWVELPNTLGMSQFADGGVLASKPYAAGGNYINKMSDYCKQCEYSVSKKTGDQSCPFNYLYWHFLESQRDKLSANHRLAMVYKTLDRMTESRKSEIKADANRFLDAL